MNLSEYLEEYRVLTLELIDNIKKDGEVDILIEQRENILKSINDLNFDEEEIRKIGNALNLLKLEKELENSVRKEKVKIKQQIETLKRSKQANMQYNSLENKARVLNKSV
jgi:hypothetical protein